MRQFWNILFSSKRAMLFLGFFIVIIATATFIEDLYDTPTTQLLIYHSKWFEIMMIVLVVMYILNIIKNKLLCKEKIPSLVFHLSFIVLIIGGGITRYFGFEADMHIVENESSDVIYTLKPYFQVRIPNKNIDYVSNNSIYFSQIEENNFHVELEIAGEYLQINYKNYMLDPPDSIFNHEIEGDPTSKFNLIDEKGHDIDALIMEISFKGEKQEVALKYNKTRYIQPFKHYNFGNSELQITYGPKPIKLPFALQLRNFTLSKYPGTNIPSTSESEVVLIDDRTNFKEEFLIAKNKVLDYGGYRFFQTSYDDDEKGTTISVNYDYYGTRITYAGYFLMLLGAVLILFSKRSGFSMLDSKIMQLRNKRKSLLMTLLFMFCLSGVGLSQPPPQNPIDEQHAEAFGHLLVQTYDGRFSSVHSLALDVIHKISGKDHFDVPGKGTMKGMQLFLDMHVAPEFWRQQKVIVIREKSLRDVLGVGKYASYSDFYSQDGTYRLEKLAQQAFQKKASDQSTMDREILKVTERVNILNMTLNGNLLKLFPEQNSQNNNWISWNENKAFQPLTGNLTILNDDLKLQKYTIRNFMRSYLISTLYARETGDYKITNKILGYFSSVQRQLTPIELLPSEAKVKWEIFYNKSNIFEKLKYVFAILGIGLLIFTFIENFKRNPGKPILLMNKILVGLIIATFIYQTFGMGLRWYLGGHAPWSNGYEVLLLVAWGGILAGFSVIRYTKITLAATAILAFFILLTAGHSYYDPQLTNLNPVLKSVWLIVHVAIITIGYGFLALSFLIGLISLIIHLVTPKKKLTLFSLFIQELTFINEKLVTIGMFLTAIGTFIGCVWANESWGNYWSWNAKQTWSLIIVLVYGLILHFKYIPKMKSALAFNIGSIISFGSVLMTFVGVNYYFTKGMHSYASDDPPIFPMWAWLAIISLGLLVVFAIFKDKYLKTIDTHS